MCGTGGQQLKREYPQPGVCVCVRVSEMVFAGFIVSDCVVCVGLIEESELVCVYVCVRD
jgi:hypothetical protein